jgi:NAD(P)-dependent dehydrogenase (short-subunit alcohol dehydrogenase family)
MRHVSVVVLDRNDFESQWGTRRTHGSFQLSTFTKAGFLFSDDVYFYKCDVSNNEEIHKVAKLVREEVRREEKHLSYPC